MASYLIQPKAFSKKVYSPAEVTVVDGKVQVTLLEDTLWDGTKSQAKFSKGNAVNFYEIAKFPAVLKPNFKDVVKVTIGEDDVIEQISPMRGVRPAKFVYFSRPDGKEFPPRPQEKEFATRDGKGKEMQNVFYVFYQMTGQVWKGATVMQMHKYLFSEKNGKLTWSFMLRKGSNSKADKSTRWGQMLLDTVKANAPHLLDEIHSTYDTVTGTVDLSSVAEDGNILPWLEKQFLATGNIVELAFEGGKIESVREKRQDEEEGTYTPAPAVEEKPSPKVEVGIPSETDEYPM